MSMPPLRSATMALTVAGLCLASAYAGYLYRGFADVPEPPPGVLLTRGQIEMRRHDVTSGLAGQLAEFMVAPGDLVVKEQVLARLEGGPMGADLQAARARLAVLRQQFAVAQTERTKFKSALSLAETQAALSEARHRAGAVTDAEAKADRERLETAIAQYDRANKAVAAIRDEATAEKATVERIEAQRDALMIRAPVGGRVGRRFVKLEQQLEAGEPVMQVIDTFMAFLQLDLGARALERLEDGARARVVVDPLPHRVLPARVRIAPDVEGDAPVIVLDLDATLAGVLKPGDAASGYVLAADADGWPLALR